MNAHENKFNTMMVLSDLFSDEVVNGWAIPRDKVDEFISDIGNAARKCGLCLSCKWISSNSMTP